MNRVIATLSIVILLLSSIITLDNVTVYAAEGSNSEWEWKISEDNNFAIITKYKGNGGHVEIPSELGGKTVRYAQMSSENEEHSIFYNKNITSIYIPKTMRNLTYNNTVGGTVNYMPVDPFLGNEIEDIQVEKDDYYKYENGIFYHQVPTGVVGIPNSSGLAAIMGTKQLSSNIQFHEDTAGIYYSAFQNKGINSVVFPEKLRYILGTAFAENNLSQVVIPENVLIIDFLTFNDNNISKLTLNENLEEIGYAAFMDNKIEEVIIPNSVTELGQNAFYDNQLKSVIIGNKLKRIESFTFSHNYLENIEIGNDVEFIGGNAFQNYYHNDFDSNVEIELNNKLKIIDVGAFKNQGVRNIVIPNSVEEIGSSAFLSSKLVNLSLPSSVVKLGNSSFKKGEIETLELNEGLKDIGNDAFEENKLEKVIIPNSVIELGSGAFYDNQLKDVMIGSGLKRIERFTFSHNYLEDIKFGNNVEYVGEYALQNYYKDDYDSNVEIELNNKLKIIDNYAFKNQGVRNIVIPNSVIEIGDNAFNNSKLENLSIPSSVVNIGDSAFAESKLKTLELHEGLKKIAPNSFRENEIEKVTIPNSVIEIGRSAFYENKLEYIKIGNGVKDIEDFTFSHNYITELIMGNSVETIGSASFQVPDAYRSSAQEVEGQSISFPSTLRSIGSNAFRNHQFSKVEISQSNNSLEIGNLAFYKNKIVRMDLPANVTSIGSSSFNGNKLEIFIARNPSMTVGASVWASNPGFNGIVDIVAPSTSLARDYADTYKGSYRFVPIDGVGELESNLEYQDGSFNPLLKSLFDRDEIVRYAVISGEFRQPNSNEWINFNKYDDVHGKNGERIGINATISGKYTVVIEGKKYQDGSVIQNNETYKVDVKSPSLTVSQNINSKTHKDILLTINASDDYSGVYSIYYIDENDNAKLMSSSELSVNKNGVYKFYAVDNVGNKSETIEHEVNNIERILSLDKPVIDNFAPTGLNESSATTNIDPIIIKDWREDDNNWKLNVSATNLKMGSNELPSGYITLNEINSTQTKEGQNATININGKGGLLDDGGILIAESDNSHGEYHLTFPNNALEIKIDPGKMREGEYKTTITWELIDSPSY